MLLLYLFHRNKTFIVSPSHPIQPLEGCYLFPACHMCSETLHMQITWVPAQDLGEETFSASTLAFFCGLHRQKVHWKNTKMEHTVSQCSSAGMHGFYQPDSLGEIKFFSWVSQKNWSDEVLLRIREEITLQVYNRLIHTRDTDPNSSTLTKLTAAKQKATQYFLLQGELRKRHHR